MARPKEFFHRTKWRIFGDEMRGYDHVGLILALFDKLFWPVRVGRVYGCVSPIVIRHRRGRSLRPL
jgi:hypothetical protein